MTHHRTAWVLSLILCLATLRAAATEPSTQDLLIIGRALSFKEGAKQATLSLAVVYDETSSRSQGEMRAAMVAVRGGLRIGTAVLKAVAVEQKQFVSSTGYDGVLTMRDVDQRRLGSALEGRGVPCLTLDTQQVKTGACTVAVQSGPSVSISINSHNAAAAQVQFATAFIMMVRGI